MQNKPQPVSTLFVVLATVFTSCLIAANLFALKQFSFGPVNFTGALLVFPISYIINDVVAEVWGYRRTRKLIWLAFGVNFLFVLLGALVDFLPGVGANVESFHAIFGLAPRVAAASFIAFLIGSFVNAAILSRMKVWCKGRWFPLRAVLSTLGGELCDSLIFFPIALAGLVPWQAMPSFVLWQVALKTLYEILILPVTVMVVKAIKLRENVDVYDNGISYNIFK